MNATRKIYGIVLPLVFGLATIKAQVLYVANARNGTIGEYGFDGSTVNASLISGLNGPQGIAISGDKLFVVNSLSDTVGEYTTSGATVNASLINNLFGDPAAVAIAGNDLFIVSPGGTIGEYTTSGATVNVSLISGLGGDIPFGIAVSGTNLFVVNESGPGPGGYGSVGEYTTSGVTINASLISGLPGPRDIAISGTNLFISVTEANVITEYSTSGKLLVHSLITGLDSPVAVAISGTNLFVVNNTSVTGYIGEYTTGGTTVETNLISEESPSFIAIGPPSPPDFTGIDVSGSTLNIMGKNGLAGESYTVLESTNLALRFSQWTPVLTNTFSTSGNFKVSIVDGAIPAEFYILEVP